MLSEFSLKLLRASVMAAHACKVSPYHWNKKHDCLEVDTSKFHRAMYTIARVFLFTNQAIMSVNVPKAFVDPNSPTRHRILPPMYWIPYSVSTLVLWTITFNESLFLTWANQALGHFIKAQREYLVRKEVRLGKSKRSGIWTIWSLNLSEMLGLGITLSPYLTPTPGIGVYFTFPDAPGYLASNFPTDKSYSVWLFLLGAVIEGYILAAYLSLLSMVLNFILTFVPNLIFWLGEIRARGSSQFTAAKLREPAHALLMYRRVQLIVLLFNELLEHARIDIIHTIAIIMAVATNVMLIRYHVQFSVAVFAFFCFELAIATSFLSYMHLMLGRVSKSSEAFIGSWRRKPNLGTDGGNGTDRKLLQRYIRSCRMLRLDIGSYGSFQRLGALRNLGRIIGYTVKVLVTMNASASTRNSH